MSTFIITLFTACMIFLSMGITLVLIDVIKHSPKLRDKFFSLAGIVFVAIIIITIILKVSTPT